MIEMNIGLHNIPYQDIKTLSDIGKLLKSTVVVIDTRSRSIYGLSGEVFPTKKYNLGVMKTLEKSYKTEVIDHIFDSIPVPVMAIQQNHLSYIEKSMNATSSDVAILRCYEDNGIIFDTDFIYVDADRESVYPVIYDINMPRIKTALEKGMALCTVVCKNMFLDNTIESSEFGALMQTKSVYGGGFITVSNVRIFVTPNLLNINKGDIVDVSVYDSDGLYTIDFTVTKPKKKCKVHIIYQILKLKGCGYSCSV